MPLPRLITVDDAAEQLGVSTRTIRDQYLATGRLTRYRVGRLVRIDADELAAVVHADSTRAGVRKGRAA